MGVDIIGDDREVDLGPKSPAERLHEHRLPGADRTGDADRINLTARPGVSGRARAAHVIVGVIVVLVERDAPAMESAAPRSETSRRYRPVVKSGTFEHTVGFAHCRGSRRKGSRRGGFELAADQLRGQIADIVVEVGQQLLAVRMADRDRADARANHTERGLMQVGCEHRLGQGAGE